MTTTTALSLRDAFTPGWDRSLHAPFRGNHYDLCHVVYRDGDEVTELAAWVADGVGGWNNREVRTTSIAALVADLERATGARVIIIDDLPDGVTIPTA